MTQVAKWHRTILKAKDRSNIETVNVKKQKFLFTYKYSKSNSVNGCVDVDNGMYTQVDRLIGSKYIDRYMNRTTYVCTQNF